MSFLQPALLLGLPLVALPIVIHLINLRRHRTVQWGAMMFLLAATQQKSGRTRLRHFLILFSRMLAIGGLIFAISRPMAGGWFGLFGGRPDTVVVLLDRSASMSRQDLQLGTSKREIAVKRIVEAIERAGQLPNLVLIDSGSNQPIAIENPTALLEMPETSATDASANVPAMMQTALDYVVENRVGQTDVWVCSDIQSTDWDADNGQWPAIRSGFSELTQTVRFHLLTYPQEVDENLTVRVVKIKRQNSDDGHQLVMDVRLRRATDVGKTKIPLGIVIDDARTVVDVEVDGDMVTLSDHVVPIDDEQATGWGKVEIPNDANPRDNVFYFTFGDDMLRRTVVVSDEPGSSWPLSLAAAPPIRKNSPFSARVLPSDEVSLMDTNETSLILWQVPIPEGDVLAKLERFVTDGGSVMFFPCGQDGNGNFQNVGWGDWDQLPLASESDIASWRDDSGLWAKSDGGKPLPVNRINVRQYRHIEGDGLVMARLRGGAPLLLQIPTDHGCVYFCSTLPQEPYSNLARDGISLFAMVQRALDQGAQRLLQSQLGVVGERVSNETSSDWEQVDGWPEGTLSTQKRHIAGIFNVANKLIARNRPTTEDTAGPLLDADIDRLFAGLEYSVVEDTIRKSSSLVSEVWRLCVMVLIIALIAEGLLCLPDVRPKRLVPAK